MYGDELSRKVGRNLLRSTNPSVRGPNRGKEPFRTGVGTVREREPCVVGRAIWSGTSGAFLSLVNLPSPRHVGFIGLRGRPKYGSRPELPAPGCSSRSLPCACSPQVLSW